MPRKRTRLFCTVEGCTEKHKAKGLCIKHYQQVRRATAPECSVDGCSEPSESKGICHKHLRWLREYGSTVKPAPDTEGRFMAGQQHSDNGCIVWRPAGKVRHPRIVIKGKRILVTHYAWERVNPALERWQKIFLLCGNTRCVNVEHMEVRQNKPRKLGLRIREHIQRKRFLVVGFCEVKVQKRKPRAIALKAANLSAQCGVKRNIRLGRMPPNTTRLLPNEIEELKLKERCAELMAQEYTDCWDFCRAFYRDKGIEVSPLGVAKEVAFRRVSEPKEGDLILLSERYGYADPVEAAERFSHAGVYVFNGILHHINGAVLFQKIGNRGNEIQQRVRYYRPAPEEGKCQRGGAGAFRRL